MCDRIYAITIRIRPSLKFHQKYGRRGLRKWYKLANFGIVPMRYAIDRPRICVLVQDLPMIFRKLYENES